MPSTISQPHSGKEKSIQKEKKQKTETYLLSNSINSTTRMRPRNRRHHTRIHHPQPLHPINPQLTINHTPIPPRHHRARTHRMAPRALRDIPHRGLNLLIALDLGTRFDFAQPNGSPGFRGHETAEGLDDLDEDADVGWVFEGAVIEDRVRKRVGAVDEDAAAGKGFQQDKRDGGTPRSGEFVHPDIRGSVRVEEEALLRLVALEDGAFGCCAGGEGLGEVGGAGGGDDGAVVGAG